jgi:hypothetical protein
MNDYLLKSMMRQRHEQILDEVTRARLSRLDRPCLNSRMKKVIHKLNSFLGQRIRPKNHRQTVLEESTNI